MSTMLEKNHLLTEDTLEALKDKQDKAGTIGKGPSPLESPGEIEKLKEERLKEERLKEDRVKEERIEEDLVIAATISDTEIELSEIQKSMLQAADSVSPARLPARTPDRVSPLLSSSPESSSESVLDYQKLDGKAKSEARQIATIFGGSPDTPHPYHKTMKFTFKRGQRDRNADELIRFAAGLGLQCVSQAATPAAGKKNSTDMTADFRGHNRLLSMYDSFSGDSFRLSFVPTHQRKKTSLDIFSTLKVPEEDAVSGESSVSSVSSASAASAASSVSTGFVPSAESAAATPTPADTDSARAAPVPVPDCCL